MDKRYLSNGARMLIDDIIAPFIEENQDIMLNDRYFTGYYKDTIEDGVHRCRPIFNFNQFLIPIVSSVILRFNHSMPEFARQDCIRRYLIDLRNYLMNNNYQMLIVINNKYSKSDEDKLLLFYFELKLDFSLVVNTCAEFLL